MDAQCWPPSPVRLPVCWMRACRGASTGCARSSCPSAGSAGSVRACWPRECWTRGRRSSSVGVPSSPDFACGIVPRGWLAFDDHSTQPLSLWSWSPLWVWVRPLPLAQLWPCLRRPIQSSHGVTPHVAARCDRRMTLPLQSAWQSQAQAYRFRRTAASAPVPARLQVCVAATDDAPRSCSGCPRRHLPSVLPSLARRES